MAETPQNKEETEEEELTGEQLVEEEAEVKAGLEAESEPSEPYREKRRPKRTRAVEIAPAEEEEQKPVDVEISSEPSESPCCKAELYYDPNLQVYACSSCGKTYQKEE